MMGSGGGLAGHPQAPIWGISGHADFSLLRGPAVVWLGIPSLWPRADTHLRGGPKSSLSQLIFIWRQGDLFFCPIPCRERCSLDASARQGSPHPGGVPSARPDPGGAVCSRAPRGTPGHPRGEEEPSQEVGVGCNVQEPREQEVSCERAFSSLPCVPPLRLESELPKKTQFSGF